MKANRLLAGLLCGCLIMGSMPVNAYATAVSQTSDVQETQQTEELSENSGGG